MIVQLRDYHRPDMDPENSMSNKTDRENAKTLTRHRSLPSRDCIEAMHQMINIRGTIAAIDKNIKHMKATSFMCQDQAD